MPNRIGLTQPLTHLKDVNRCRTLIRRLRKVRREKRGEDPCGSRCIESHYNPYLIIRYANGDTGARPINAPFWESPDIWVEREDGTAGYNGPRKSNQKLR